MRRKAQEPPFHPGVTGEGNGRTGEGLEPLTDAMKERSLPLPGGCWKVQSIRLHQRHREAPMEKAYDGRQVVGMDLHRRRSVLVRMTEDGRRLGMSRITNSPQELRAEIARARKSPKVVLEATYGWYWAADTLAAAGAEVHLAHPLGVKAFSYRRVKNDERDSADLADLLRMGRLPEAWIAPHEVRELREITRYRMLCRTRHRHRYAEARIMPSSRARCRLRVVAAAETSA